MFTVLFRISVSVKIYFENYTADLLGCPARCSNSNLTEMLENILVSKAKINDIFCRSRNAIKKWLMECSDSFHYDTLNSFPLLVVDWHAVTSIPNGFWNKALRNSIENLHNVPYVLCSSLHICEFSWLRFLLTVQLPYTFVVCCQTFAGERYVGNLI